MKKQAKIFGSKFSLFLKLGASLFLLQLVSCSKDEVNHDPVPRTLQVWLHHVNTPDKARLYQYSYNGFELDVHYDTNFKTFIVKHNYNDTTTLHFSAWLTSITDPGRLGFWLDFKNLSPENKTAALAELIRIRQEFNLSKHIIIVESSDPSLLPPFDTLNFRISYYIPTFDPSAITEEEELAYQIFIQEGVSTYGMSTISAYFSQLGFIKKWFPEMNKLTWYLESPEPELKDSVINLVRKDPTVEVLLVSENSRDYQVNHAQSPYLIEK